MTVGTRKAGVEMKLSEYLEDMAMIPALSGYEQKMYDYMENAFRKLNLNVEEDVFGNCITKIEGTDKDAPVIMIFGHMDQLGFFVKYIDNNGFIYLERLGGISEKVLPGLAIQLQNHNGEMIDGVIGVKSHHITPPEEKYVVDKYQKLFVDVGADSYEEVLEMGIDVGCPVVYKPNFQRLKNKKVYATSLDNRIACSILLDLAQKLSTDRPENTVYLVGTVQEEYNLRGGMMAARSIQPQIAIALDVALECGTPDTLGVSRVHMGKGPVLSIYNFHGRGTLNGTIGHPAMVRLFEETAVRNKIPVQKSVNVGLLTDLSYVQLEGKGVYSLDVGIPCRYTHSPVEVCDLGDLELTSELLLKVLKNIKNFNMKR
jgi:putative aminopeptidase FrvX